MNIREKIKNKIKSRKGMSIGEVLFSVLIMLLATSTVTATVSLAISEYTQTLSGSEANVLASTLESLMTSELAYTTEVHVNSSTDNTVTKFQSQNYNKKSSLSMFDVDDETTKIGKMIVTYPDKADEKAVHLLGEGSYPNNLLVTKPSIQYAYDEEKGEGMFTVTFSIKRNGTTILDRTFNVINVNNTEPSYPAT